MALVMGRRTSSGLEALGLLLLMPFVLVSSCCDKTKREEYGAQKTSIREAVAQYQRNNLSVEFYSIWSDPTKGEPRNKRRAHRKSGQKRSSYNQISFEICNKSERALLDYSFTVSGFFHDHSTPHTIRVSEPELKLGLSEFTGDVIIPKKSCRQVTWSEELRVFDNYSVKDWTGDWAQQ